ncbi:MAG: hypothetical protein WAM72_21870 [Xanthobacteraceae bacterium]
MNQFAAPLFLLSGVPQSRAVGDYLLSPTARCGDDMNFRSTPGGRRCAESRAGRITQAPPGNNNEEVE